MQECSLGKAGTHVVVRVAKKCSAIVAIICKQLNICSCCDCWRRQFYLDHCDVYYTRIYASWLPHSKMAECWNEKRNAAIVSNTSSRKSTLIADKEIVGKTIRKNFECPPNQVNVYNGLLEFFSDLLAHLLLFWSDCGDPYRNCSSEVVGITFSLSVLILKWRGGHMWNMR